MLSKCRKKKTLEFDILNLDFLENPTISLGFSNYFAVICYWLSLTWLSRLPCYLEKQVCGQLNHLHPTCTCICTCTITGIFFDTCTHSYNAKFIGQYKDVIKLGCKYWKNIGQDNFFASSSTRSIEKRSMFKS